MKKFFLLIALIVVATNAPIPSAASAASIELVVILNTENPTEKLNPAEVKDYWLRRGARKKWKTTNTGLLPVDRKAKCPERELFYSKVLGLSVDAVEAYFAAKQYQAAENPPEKFATDKEIITYVSEHPGAIGFVNKNSLAGDLKSSIKIVCSIVE